jgi:hypothetical protein
VLEKGVSRHCSDLLQRSLAETYGSSAAATAAAAAAGAADSAVRGGGMHLVDPGASPASAAADAALLLPGHDELPTLIRGVQANIAATQVQPAPPSVIGVCDLESQPSLAERIRHPSGSVFGNDPRSDDMYGRVFSWPAGSRLR